MNRWILVLALAAIFAGAFLLHKPQLSPTARIDIAREIDIGVIENSRPTATIEIGNRGAEALRLSHFQKSCACVRLVVEANGIETELPDELVIPPQGRIRLIVTIQTGRVDRIRNSVGVSFRTNDLSAPNAGTTIYFSHLEMVLAEPQQAIFGRVEPGRSTSKVFRLLAVAVEKPHLGELQFPTGTAGEFRCVTDFRDTGERSEGRRVWEAQLEMQVRPCISDRVLHGEATVRVQFDARESTIAIPDHAIVRNEYSISPATLTLPRHSNTGSIFSARIMITRDDKAPFEIDVLDSNGMLTTADSKSSICQTITIELPQQLTLVAGQRLVKVQANCAGVRSDMQIPVTVSIPES